MIRTTILAGVLSLALTAPAFAFNFGPVGGGPRGEEMRNSDMGTRDVPSPCTLCGVAWGKQGNSTTNPQNLGNGPVSGGSGTPSGGVKVGGSDGKPSGGTTGDHGVTTGGGSTGSDGKPAGGESGDHGVIAGGV